MATLIASHVHQARETLKVDTIRQTGVISAASISTTMVSGHPITAMVKHTIQAPMVIPPTRRSAIIMAAPGTAEDMDILADTVVATDMVVTGVVMEVDTVMAVDTAAAADTATAVDMAAVAMGMVVDTVMR
jgi:hypothetical protein